jgi:hypothetical protein
LERTMLPRLANASAEEDSSENDGNVSKAKDRHRHRRWRIRDRQRRRWRKGCVNGGAAASKGREASARRRQVCFVKAWWAEDGTEEGEPMLREAGD